MLEMKSHREGEIPCLTLSNALAIPRFMTKYSPWSCSVVSHIIIGYTQENFSRTVSLVEPILMIREVLATFEILQNPKSLGIESNSLDILEVGATGR